MVRAFKKMKDMVKNVLFSLFYFLVVFSSYYPHQSSAGGNPDNGFPQYFIEPFKDHYFKKIKDKLDLNLKIKMIPTSFQFGGKIFKKERDLNLFIYWPMEKKIKDPVNLVRLTLCHEIGHYLAKGPYKEVMGLVTERAVEGASDYFSTHKCFFSNFSFVLKKPRPKKLKVGEWGEAYCKDQFFEKEKRRCEVLYPIALDYLFNLLRYHYSKEEFLKAKNWSLKKKNLVEVNFRPVKKTISYHPEAFCRLETIMRGALNKERPPCWFGEDSLFKKKGSKRYASFKRYALKRDYQSLKKIIPKLFCQKENDDTDLLGNSPFHFAAYLGDLKLVKMLERKNSTCSSFKKLNHLGISPIHLAIKNNSLGVLGHFLNKKEKLNIFSLKGPDPLSISIRSRNQKAALMILSSYKLMKKTSILTLHLEEMFIDSLNWNMPRLAREFIKLGLIQNKLILQRGSEIAKEMARDIRLTY